jgi:hypothetical protein
VLTTTIPAQGTVEYSYRLGVPPFGPQALRAYQHAVIIDDGAGGVSTAHVSIAPPTRVLFYPLMTD